MFSRLERVRRNSLEAFLAAVLLAALALVVRLLVNQLAANTAPYLIFFFAAVGSAALFGFWPGVVTALLGAVMAGFFQPRPGLFHVLDSSDRYAPFRYLVSAIFVSYVCEKLIQSRQRVHESEERLRVQAEELRRSNRELEQFAFVASHDMREPIRTIKLHTELLLRNIHEGRYTDLAQSAAFVSDSVKRMEQQIQGLLSYSRILHTPAEPSPVDVAAAAREALRSCQALVEESRAEIHIADLPPVLAEEGPVIQLFQNLLTNAMKYRKSGDPVKVAVTAESRGSVVQFCVEDNGIGFEPQYADIIFRLFTRLNGTKHSGTGIGLAICRRIVEQFGGKIWAESKVGVGSRFLFTLPSA